MQQEKDGKQEKDGRDVPGREDWNSVDLEEYLNKKRVSSHYYIRYSFNFSCLKQLNKLASSSWLTCGDSSSTKTRFSLPADMKLLEGYN